jgi:hypothetical protein
MNNRLRDIILICSLVFNFTLLGFLLYRQVNRPPVPLPHHHVHNDVMTEKRRMIRSKHIELGEAKRQFMIMLASPELNEENLKDKLEQVIVKQTELERTIGENLIELRKRMTPEEAEKFLRRVRTQEENPENMRRIPRRR